MTRGGPRARLRDDTGSAVVEFPLVGVLVLVIAIAIVQTAVLLHTRNTLTDAAVQGAHEASLVGHGPQDGADRTRLLIEQRLGRSYDAAVTAGVDDEGRIRVQVVAPMPVIGLLGPGGTLRVDGHAQDEDAW